MKVQLPEVLLTDERLGQLLAAVGNHEAKALTFLAMEDQVPYGVSSLHQVFLEIQGGNPVFVGTVNLQQKYVLHSFEPIGLVARTLTGGRFLRHVKVDDDRIATALCGHLLRLSEHHSASLTQMFGKAATRIGDHARAPIRRIAILRALKTADGPVSQAWLSAACGLPTDHTLTAAMAALATASMIKYGSRPTYELKTSYLVHEPIVQQRSPKALTRCIVSYLDNRLLQNGGGPLRVTRDEIEDHLQAQEPWARSYIRDTVQRAMARMASRGQVELVESHLGQTSHSSAHLTDSQRTFLTELLDMIHGLQQADAEVVASGVEHARLILAEPERVRALIKKAISTNKLLVNPASRSQKHQLVLQELAHGPATAEDLTLRLTPRLNKQLTGATLAELTRAGLVVARTLPRSPQKLWELAPPGQ